MRLLVVLVSLVLFLPPAGYLATTAAGPSLGHQAQTWKIDSALSFLGYLIVGFLKITVLVAGALFGWIYVLVFGQTSGPAVWLVVAGTLGLALAIAGGNRESHGH